MEGEKNGEFVGAFAAYGYVKSEDDNHKLVIDEEAAEIVRKIFDWKVNEGIGNLSICHRLNDMGILNPTGYKRKRLNQNYNNFRLNQEDYSWCPSTVRNILKNDIYIGNITQGKRRVKSYKIHKLEQVPEEEWITVENMHQPIIDKELFEKAQSLKKVDIRVQNTGTLSIWAGKLKCADCKRAMHKKSSKNKMGTVYEYYICGTYRKKSNKLCTKHTLKVENLEMSVLKAINLHIGLLDDINEIVGQVNDCAYKTTKNDDIDNMIISKQNEITRIFNFKKLLYEDWKNDDITRDEYFEFKQKYEEDIERLKGIILNLDKQKQIQKKMVSENCKWIDDFIKNKGITELDRCVITELVDYIEVYEDNKISIHFKFNRIDQMRKR